MTMADREPRATIGDQLAQVEQELKIVHLELEHLLQRQSKLQRRKEQLELAAIKQRKTTLAENEEEASSGIAWDDSIHTTLRTVFKLDALRPLQGQVIRAALKGEDVLCLMPAGGGKSLCYQLPAVMPESLANHSLTLVISPLLALITDQVAALKRLADVKVAALSSLSSKEETSIVLKALDPPIPESPSILYCTPERIISTKRLMAKLEKVYQSGRLKLIAIDECHCASTWGNDFRPDYRKLGILRQQFPDTPLMALTATATSKVCDDVIDLLGIPGARVFQASINRPNLFYEVVRKPATTDELVKDVASWIRTHFQGSSGIVYVLTRKDAEEFSNCLKNVGISAEAYHADMEPDRRMAIQAAWYDGSLLVIVATIAFGMGISKPDVRFVIHHTIPKSLENYYQESGRAGRDGLLARCRLYYRFSDYLRQCGVVAMEHNWESHLRSILNFVTDSTTCRRAALSKHFAEPPALCNASCDVCRDAVLDDIECHEDVSQAACEVLATLTSWPKPEKRATLVQLIDGWRSGKHGNGAKKLGVQGCEKVIEALVLLRALQVDFGFTAYCTNVYLRCGPTAGAVMGGHQKVQIAPIIPPSAAATATISSKGHQKMIQVEAKEGGAGEVRKSRKRTHAADGSGDGAE